MRAYQAAKNAVPGENKLGADFVERKEFRLLLLYLKRYFEIHSMYIYSLFIWCLSILCLISTYSSLILPFCIIYLPQVCSRTPNAHNAPILTYLPSSSGMFSEADSDHDHRVDIDEFKASGRREAFRLCIVFSAKC